MNDTSDLIGVTFYSPGKDGKHWKASTTYLRLTGKGLSAYFSTKAEACSVVDSVNRYFHGLYVISNYDLRGDVFLFPRAGRNLGKRSMAHGPDTCNQLPDEKPLIYRGIFCMKQLTRWKQDGGMERGVVVMPFEETAVFQLLDPSVKSILRQKAQQIKKYAKEEERSLHQRKTMQETGTADVVGVTYVEVCEQPWRAYFSCRGVIVLDAFFATKREACLASDACGRFFYGSFACSNFSCDGSFSALHTKERTLAKNESSIRAPPAIKARQTEK